MRLVLSFIWIRATAAGRFVAGSSLARRIVGLRAVRFIVRLAAMFWDRLVLRPWRWSGRSVRRLRIALGKRQVWYWVVCWALCGALAAAIVRMPPIAAVAPIAGAAIIAVLAKRLEFGIVAVVILAASILHHEAIPQPIKIGGFGPNTTELLILSMLVIIFLRSCRDGKFLLFKSPITLPLILIFISVMVSMVESYRLFKTGIDQDLFYYGQIYNNARPMFYYTFFFVVAFGIHTERQLRWVIRAIVWVGVGVSIVVALQYYLGPHGITLFIGRSYTHSFSPDEQEIARSLPPGLAPICVFFLVSVAYAGYQRFRAGLVSTLTAAILGVGLLFSFYRSFWVTSLLGILIIWLASNGVAKRRLVVLGAGAILLTIIGGLAIDNISSSRESSARSVSSIVTERFMSVFESDTYATDQSYRNRVRENRMAIEKIKENPIFGIGSGTPRQYLSWTRPGTYTQVFYPVPYIHNSYIEMFMVYGLIGIVGFLWISIFFLIRCFRLFCVLKSDSWKAVTIGIFAAYVGYLIRSWTQPHIVHDVFYIITTALVWGIIEVISRLHGQEALCVRDGVAPLHKGVSRASAVPVGGRFSAGVSKAN